MKKECELCKRIADESKIKAKEKVGSWCCESCPIKKELEK